MSVAVELECYNSDVLPILMFASQTWSLTVQHMERLERVHSSCLRRIISVRLADRHRFVDSQEPCGTVSLADHLTWWLGHVLRMDEGRVPQVALPSSLYGVSK